MVEWLALTNEVSGSNPAGGRGRGGGWERREGCLGGGRIQLMTV